MNLKSLLRFTFPFQTSLVGTFKNKSPRILSSSFSFSCSKLNLRAIAMSTSCSSVDIDTALAFNAVSSAAADPSSTATNPDTDVLDELAGEKRPRSPSPAAKREKVWCIQLYNIPRYGKPKAIGQFLRETAKIEGFEIAHNKPGNAFVVLQFEEKIHADAANTILSTFGKYPGEKKALRSSGVREERKQTRSNEEQSDWREKKRLRKEEEQAKKGGEECQAEPGAPTCISDVVTPLWKLPYAKQLGIKQINMKRLLKKYLKSFEREYPDHKWETKLMVGPSNGQLCPVLPIKPSPVIFGYRNKCEFTCGVDESGADTAGFNMGRIVNKVGVENLVGRADECLHISSLHKDLANCMSQFMQQPSQLCRSYNKVSHEGVWRTLRVISAEENKEVLVVVCMDSDNVSAGQLDVVLANLLQFFLDWTSDPAWVAKYGHKLVGVEAIKQVGISEVVTDKMERIELYNCRSLAEDPPKPGGGQESEGELNKGPKEGPDRSMAVYEKMHNLIFRRQPPAFFQVNTPGAAGLYGVVRDWAQCDKETLLFDICCGTGSIGMVIAGQAGKVVGLELVPEAIQDAEYNVKLNKIDNMSFVCGKAEDTLDATIRQYLPHHGQGQFKTIVGVVDPPRGGLHPSVTRTLRVTRQLERLIYVSCNAKSCMVDLSKLMQPPSKKYTGLPFTPVKALPVDMFPHCDHTELILLLERGPTLERTMVEFRQEKSQLEEGARLEDLAAWALKKEGPEEGKEGGDAEENEEMVDHEEEEEGKEKEEGK